MRLPRHVVLLSALGVGVFQIAGTFGAAHEQTDRKPVDVLAIALVLVGPIALSMPRPQTPPGHGCLGACRRRVH